MTPTTMSTGIHSGNFPSICLGQQSLLTLPYMDLMLERVARTRKRLSWKSPTGWGSALARRGGRVVGTDTRSLSFVHQVPSNGEEHDEDSDNGPKIDAEH